MKDELVDSTYLRLKACATSVEQYFTWDIREDILEKDDISYQFIDSLQDEHIEQTLFMEDERFITSIVDKDGNRACLLYTSPSPRDRSLSRMPSSA